MSYQILCLKVSQRNFENWTRPPSLPIWFSVSGFFFFLFMNYFVKDYKFYFHEPRQTNIEQYWLNKLEHHIFPVVLYFNNFCFIIMHMQCKNINLACMKHLNAPRTRWMDTKCDRFSKSFVDNVRLTRLSNILIEIIVKL